LSSQSGTVLQSVRAFFQKVKMYLRITQMNPIARRYFVKNGFDGSMTMLGIIVGSWVVGVTDPRIIVTAGLGACLAMGISGLFGAYLTEKAERKRHLKTLEAAMITDLQDSIFEEASSFVSFYAAIVDGASPILTAIFSLIPFALTIRGILLIWDAYIASFIVSLAALFLLGLYLGRIAKENILLYGAQTLAAGVITVGVAFLLGAI
jgi:predicted membrane protein (TIGR00267 family)